jgi:hypothetical protein
MPTKSMLADLRTKASPTPDFHHLCRMIGLTVTSQNFDVSPLGGELE